MLFKDEGEIDMYLDNGLKGISWTS